MTLKELWDKLVAEAPEQGRVVASVYASHVEALSDELGDRYDHQEYPKWVHGKLVEDAEGEAAAREAAGEVVMPAPASAAPAPAATSTTGTGDQAGGDASTTTSASTAATGSGDANAAGHAGGGTTTNTEGGAQ